MRHLFDSPIGASPFNRGAPKNVAPLFAAALPSIITGGASLIGGAVNNIVNRSNMNKQVEQAKELAKYQWDNFQSYPAQVQSMTKAGLNPAVMFGQSGASSASPSINMPTAHPVDLGFASSLSDIGNFVKSLADAKKAGADTEKSLAEVDAIKLQNDLTREFGRKSWILDISQKYQNVLLAKKTNDIKEQEKAINEFKKATEKVISESKGIEKNMLQKRFDNLDVQINLENKLQGERIKTEKTTQQANKAAANASNSQASVNREIARYQRVLADVEESSSPFKLENLLRHYAASNMISDADYQEAYRRYERLRSINADNDKHEWNKALDAFMFYLEEHVKGLSPFVSAASTNYSTK